MPLFYLHLCNGVGLVEDEEGQALSDLGVARQTAVKALRDVSAEEIKEGRINSASFIEIEDEQRWHVATVHFADAVEITDEVVREPRELTVASQVHPGSQ